MSVLIFIVILLVLILVHEYGHFFTAKKFGIRVDEFGVGFPPKAKTLFWRDGTEYTLNWIPFGGFVKIFGQNGVDSIEDNSSTNTVATGLPFYKVAKWKQAIVLVAGVVMNFLLAVLLYFCIFVFGAYTSVDETINKDYLVTDPETVISSTLPDYPADVAGLLPGDVVVSVTTGDEVVVGPTPEQIINIIENSNGESIGLGIEREGKVDDVVLSTSGSEDGRVGVMLAYVAKVRYPAHKAIVEATRTSAFMFAEVTKGILGLFTGQTKLSTVSGPVGIVGIVGDVYKVGFAELLAFTALISLNLAVINLVPFPALDGGRLLFVGIEALIKKPVPQRFFEITNTIGFFLLIGLMLLVTVRDVLHLF